MVGQLVSNQNHEIGAEYRWQGPMASSSIAASTPRPAGRYYRLVDDDQPQHQNVLVSPLLGAGRHLTGATRLCFGSTASRINIWLESRLSTHLAQLTYRFPPGPRRWATSGRDQLDWLLSPTMSGPKRTGTPAAGAGRRARRGGTPRHRTGRAARPRRSRIMLWRVIPCL